MGETEQHRPSRRVRSAVRGRSFCFTGTLIALSLHQAQRAVRAQGGTVHTTVQPGDLLGQLHTDYLVRGVRPAKSAQFAPKCKSISEPEFLEMVWAGRETRREEIAELRRVLVEVETVQATFDNKRGFNFDL